MGTKNADNVAVAASVQGSDQPAPVNVRALFKVMADMKASDLFFSCNSPIKIKIDGRIRSINKQVLSPQVMRLTAYSVMTPEQLELYEREGEIDFALSEPNVGRFRATVFRQRGLPAMVLRYIAQEMPQLELLGLPEVLSSLAMQKRGLILVVGATGSGKSTTLAAMINHRNEHSADHIVTIEDPIEFLHAHKKSVVNQREVGYDTKDFGSALRSVMRAAPDVILIGEIRDQESMQAAINLSGTGHLVLATLHANNSPETLDRILNMFPSSHHKQLMLDMSQYLRAILAQRLIIGKEGKRVGAMEVMLNTPHISELVRRGDVSAIKEAIENSSETGVQSFDSALLNLYRGGRISLEEALRNADSRSNMEARINFG